MSYALIPEPPRTKVSKAIQDYEGTNILDIPTRRALLLAWRDRLGGQSVGSHSSSDGHRDVSGGLYSFAGRSPWNRFDM